jgi:hypothetical protein
MLAIAAAICFAVAFVLKLVGVGIGQVDLVVLGLVFLAVHIAYPIAVRR